MLVSAHGDRNRDPAQRQPQDGPPGTTGSGGRLGRGRQRGGRQRERRTRSQLHIGRSLPFRATESPQTTRVRRPATSSAVHDQLPVMVGVILRQAPRGAGPLHRCRYRCRPDARRKQDPLSVGDIACGRGSGWSAAAGRRQCVPCVSQPRERAASAARGVFSPQPGGERA
jgi:hypothetical protein